MPSPRSRFTSAMAPMSPVQPQKLEDIPVGYHFGCEYASNETMRHYKLTSLKYRAFCDLGPCNQESHASDLTESKGESADVGRQPGLKMLAALCLASAVEGHTAGKP